MKKLSKLTLRKIDVEQSDILNKRQLKQIVGGYNDDELWEGTWNSYWCSCNGQSWVCVAPTADHCEKASGCKGDTYSCA